MAEKIKTAKDTKSRKSNKISDAVKVCHSVSKFIKKLAAAYKKRQYKQYKKCGKFQKKTGFWKFKKLKKLKKAKFVARKPRKIK